MTFPTLEFESKLLVDYPAIIAIDEVGRGSLAGPVAVGAFLMTQNQIGLIPPGLQDSKLIKESKRSEVAENVRSWGISVVEFVSASQIDKHGIISCLKTAGLRCLEKLARPEAIILLDGNQNWLENSRVLTRVKADRDCAAVSAASVIAKVSRDTLMIEFDQKYPNYDFASNKGYSSPSHIQALRNHGPSEIHRKTWLTKILSEELF